MVTNSIIPESDIWGPSIILPPHNERGGIIVGEKTIDEVEGTVTKTTNAILDPSSDPGLYEALVMNSIAPTVAYDKDGKLIVWNRSMEELTEYTFDEVRWLTSDEIMKLLYKWDDYEEVVHSLGELHRTWVWYKKKLFTMTTKSGKKKIVRWNTFPYAWGTGRSWEDLTEYYTTKWMLLKDPNFWCFNRMWLLDALTQSIAIKKIDEKRKIFEADEKKNQPIGAYSFAFWDIDNFKEFNDKYGHAVGDIVLKKLVEFYQKELRGVDIVSRFGWDEFIFILKNSDRIQTLSKLSRLREEFSRFSFEMKGDGTMSEIFHDSRTEAGAYISQKEKEENETKTGSIFFWAVGTSWGVSDIVYDTEKWKFEGYDLLQKNYKKSDTLGLVYHDDEYKEQKKEEAIIVLNHKKSEADRVLLAVKYIELLKEELGLHDDWKGKNGIGIPVYNKDDKLDGVNVQYDTFSLYITLAELVELEKRRAELNMGEGR